MNEENTPARRRHSADPFNLRFRGCFSRFAVSGDESIPIFQISVALGVRALDHLNTAKEALPDNAELPFEAMIQREINPSHVTDITNYLTGPKLTRYFPPLLAALVERSEARLEDEYPTPSYSIDGDPGDQWAVIEWGDLFHLRLGIEESPASGSMPLTLPLDGGDRTVVIDPSLAELRVNQDRCRIVVVDGQHRLKALRRIAGSDDSPKLTDLTCGTCIFWPAHPASSDLQAAGVLQVLRLIFVDVNRGDRVSGHFVILLDDSRLSSIVIREFCEATRQDLLEHIEWDQHSDSRTRQLSLADKITSVGLLKEALEDSGVSRWGARPDYHLMSRVTPFLLAVDACETPLDEEQAAAIRNLSLGDEVPLALRDPVLACVRRGIVPSLKQIFGELRPYRRLIEISRTTKDAWLKESEGGEQAQEAVRAIRTVTPPAEPLIAEMAVQLNRRISEAVTSDDDILRVVRANRFQQGLLGAFYVVVNAFLRAEFAGGPADVARAFIHYLNSQVFRDGERLFSTSEPWMFGTITRGPMGAILKVKKTRTPVTQLLLSALGRPQAASELANAYPGGSEPLEEELLRTGSTAASLFIARHLTAQVEEFVSNIEYEEDLTDEAKAELLSLRDIRDGGLTHPPITRREAARQLQSRAEGHLVEKRQLVLSRFSQVLGFDVEEGTPQQVEDDD